MKGQPTVQVQLLVWIFVMRVMMVIASGGPTSINDAIAKAKYANADKMNFEAPLTFAGVADLDRLGRR